MKNSEEQLLTDVARGDKSAFRALYQLYSPAIYRLVKRMVGESDSDEVFQEAMLRVWKNAPLFDPAKGKAKSWIYLVATRHCLNFIESRKSRKNCVEVEINENIEDSDACSPEQTVIKGQQADDAIAMLENLPVDLRTAVALRHLDDLSIDEIAEITNVPAGTVKSRIFYGLKKLRNFFFKENSHEKES